MKSYSSLIIVLFLILAMAACKSKQVVQKDEVSEIKASTDSVKVDMEDNLFIAYLPPGEFPDNTDTSTITADSIYKFQDALSWAPKFLKKKPMLTKGGWFIYQTRKKSVFDIYSESNDLKKSSSEKGQYNKKESKSYCHIVLFWIVLLIFICLVVRYRKIIAKLFGAY